MPRWYQKTRYKISGVLLFSISAVVAIFVSRDPTIFLMISSTPKRPALIETTQLSLASLTKDDIENRLQLSVQFLKSQQKDDGSWLKHAGISAITLSSLLHTPFKLKKEDYAQKAISYLLQLQQENGSFYTSFSVSMGMANYVTSCTIMALAAADKDKYQTQINNATDYLASAQRKEGLSEGGMGYGEQGNGADLSNLHMALEAMKDAGVDKESPFYQNALKFIARCQDSENNHQSQTATGGFAYKPEAFESDTPQHDLSNENSHVYGGMTYAGLDSLLLCDIPMNDPKIKDILTWIEHNYSVTTHPGKGDLSLYFYYATMAKALHLSGLKELKTAQGTKDWARELAYAILQQQSKDGSWVNDNPKYFEGYPVMATAYAMKALNYCLKSL